ncbi:hypothetical protein LEN26_009273 [Aphanomyces euteiches]|nr:hypothetical protein LEN26_009273 [Aphanomyces euteiches]
MMDALRTTLALPEIWSILSSFQCGTYREIQPFRVVRDNPTRESQFDEWLAPLQIKLKDYYAEYGTTRLDQLVQRLPNMKNNVIFAAIAANDVPLLKTLHAKFDLFSCPRKILNIASKCGSLEVLIYLHELGHSGCTGMAMNLAAKHGHLNVVKFLHSYRTEGCNTGASECAAGGGHLDVLEWLHVNRTEGCDTRAMNRAAQNGHLKVIQWLHDKGYPCSGLALNLAVKNGHFSVVQWLHTHCNGACQSGRILPSVTDQMSVGLVEWLCANRNELDILGLLTSAIDHRRDDIAALLTTRFGISWSSEHTKAALQDGKLNSLQYFYRQNPGIFEVLDEDAITLSIHGENLELVQWLCGLFGLQFPLDEQKRVTTFKEKLLMRRLMKQSGLTAT